MLNIPLPYLLLPQSHLQQEAIQPVSLGIFEDTIYWADWAGRDLFAASKFTGKQMRHLLSATRPVAVLVHHEIFQKGGGSFFIELLLSRNLPEGGGVFCY